MSTRTRSTLGLLVVAFAFSAFSCGSSGGSGTGGASGSGGKSGSGGASGTGTGGTSGNESTLQKACRALCQSEGTHNCHDSASTTVTDCMSYRCPPTGEANSHEMPATCAAAWEGYYKCLTTQEAAGTPNPDEPSKPGCQEPGACTAEAAAIGDAHCPQ